MTAHRGLWIIAALAFMLFGVGPVLRRAHATSGQSQTQCPPCYTYDSHAGDCVPNKGQCVDDGACGGCPSGIAPGCSAANGCTGWTITCTAPQTNQALQPSGTDSTQSASPCLTYTVTNCGWVWDPGMGGYGNNPMYCPDGPYGLCCLPGAGQSFGPYNYGDYIECCSCS
jgi:hypothetical protein